MTPTERPSTQAGRQRGATPTQSGSELTGSDATCLARGQEPGGHQRANSKGAEGRSPPRPDSLDLNSNLILTQPNVISAVGAAATALRVSGAPSDRTGPSTSDRPAAQSGQTPNNQQWLTQVAAQTQLGVRTRMSQASDQLDQSLRQLYASASSIAADVRPPSYHNIPGIVPYYAGRSVGPPPSYDDVVNPYAPPPSYHSLFGQMREARKSSRGLLDLLRRLLIILVSTLGCTLLIGVMIFIPFTMIIVGAVYIDECRIEHIPAFLLVGGLVWATKNLLHCYGQCRRMPPVGDLGDSRAASLDGALAEVYLTPRIDLSSSSSPSSPSSSSSSQRASSGGANSLSRHLEAALRNTSNGGDEHLAAPGVLDTSGDPLANLNFGAHLSHLQQHHEEAPAAHGGPPGQLDHSRQRRRRLKSSICESLLNCVLFGWFIAGCVIVFRNYEPDFEDPASPRYCHKTVYMFTFGLISSAILLLGLFVGCICCLMVSSAVASRQDEATGDLA